MYLTTGQQQALSGCQPGAEYWQHYAGQLATMEAAIGQAQSAVNSIVTRTDLDGRGIPLSQTTPPAGTTPAAVSAPATGNIPWQTPPFQRVNQWPQAQEIPWTSIRPASAPAFACPAAPEAAAAAVAAAAKTEPTAAPAWLLLMLLGIGALA